MFFFEYCDAPRAWGLYFQDSASPQMEALIELHNNIMFYLVMILFTVGWILISIIRNFISTRSPISNKYLNHGRNVPIQKYSNVRSPISNKVITPIRAYSTYTEGISGSSIKIYENAYSVKKDIINENIGKSGIYMWTNLLTGDIYIGQSGDLSKRFRKYFTLSYLKSKEGFIISRALIKYGYTNFSLSILEYCDKSDLLVREQYYLDKLNPQYNILKIAGNSLGYKHSQESRDKRSKALKGVYTGIKSALFGTTYTEETKLKMSLKRGGENNHFYGKTHSEEYKELMRQKALNRKDLFETKDKISKSHGNPINIYEKCSSEKFQLIGSFVSARRAANFLGMNGSMVIKYMKSGTIYKDRYKFSSNNRCFSTKNNTIQTSAKFQQMSQNISLVAWGQNLSATTKERFTRAELGMVKLPINTRGVIVGLILSNAWLRFAYKRSTNALLGFKQSLIHSEYIWFVFSLLSHYCSSYPSLKSTVIEGNRHYALEFYTRSMPCFTELYYLFYPNGVKIIPEDIYNLLTPVALAHLIMGDGSVKPHGLILCTDSYSLKDVVRLMNVLIIKYRLECTLRFYPKNQYRIYIKQSSMPILRSIVISFMAKSMLYKIDL